MSAYASGYNKNVMTISWEIVSENWMFLFFWNFYIFFSAKWITWIEYLRYTSTFLPILSKISKRNFTQRKKSAFQRAETNGIQKLVEFAEILLLLCLSPVLKVPLHYKFHCSTIIKWYYFVLRISNIIRNYTDSRCFILLQNNKSVWEHLKTVKMFFSTHMIVWLFSLLF